MVKTCSHEANMLVQHRPTVTDATCWPRFSTMLENAGLSLDLLRIFVQHRATFDDVGFV